MGKYRKTTQIVILIGVLLLGGYAIGKALFASDDGGLPKIGEKPPEFALLGEDQEAHKLSDYEGKALVINFWGTFCPPCVIETPEFQRQYEKWTSMGKPFEIIGINLGEDSLTVRNFVQQYGLTYEMLYDKGRKIMAKYGVESFPTTFFVKPDGTIMDIFVGGMTEEDIDKRVTKLLQS
ncbi:peroxiredoxin [Paenibacillus phyllosphaerae]|uniref:Peroxiredoxin n=1 Tax=Paenibacillus phyllosphaerae TaxID=274593 RepID=A0A7W5FLH7_9BACL|nr:redoxin domain-containing protein [Paenibacillus phyllosphaerae]MBB3109240.1 peroxiredoxin [Paenibacillus phyllosphaerae]